MKKNILVTGGLGHIGSDLIRAYSGREDVRLIRILDNLSVQRYCSLFNLPGKMHYEFLEGDINDPEALRRAMHGIHRVIHLAAITDAPSTKKIPEKTREVNFEGTRKVLEEAAKQSVERLVFASTTSVYGETEGLVDETFSDYRPATPYAEAKLAAEKIVEEAGKTGKIDTRVLRMGTIFGSSIGMRFHTAANKFTYLAAMGRPLTIWRAAYEQKRPYLGLNDAVRAFQFLEQGNGAGGEVYNAVTKNYSVREVVDAIRKFVPDVRLREVDSPIINQKSYEVSSAKIREIGFDFRDNLEILIAETLRLFAAIKNPPT